MNRSPGSCGLRTPGRIGRPEKSNSAVRGWQIGRTPPVALFARPRLPPLFLSTFPGRQRRGSPTLGSPGLKGPGVQPPDPIEAIKFRMEQQGLTRKDLEPLIGTRTRVAEVLNRKRSLSIAMIRRLHERHGIPAEVLIRPSQKRRAA